MTYGTVDKPAMRQHAKSHVTHSCACGAETVCAECDEQQACVCCNQPTCPQCRWLLCRECGERKLTSGYCITCGQRSETDTVCFYEDMIEHREGCWDLGDAGCCRKHQAALRDDFRRAQILRDLGGVVMADDYCGF